MTSFVGYFQAVAPRDNSPLVTKPARVVRCLDLDHIRRREITLPVSRHRERTLLVLGARVLEHLAELRSWWNRTVRALVADAMRQPAAEMAIPPRTTGALRGARLNRVSLRPVGLAARTPGGEC